MLLENNADYKLKDNWERDALTVVKNKSALTFESDTPELEEIKNLLSKQHDKDSFLKEWENDGSALWRRFISSLFT